MPATAAICCRCNKDVSNEKRVKDARGNIYCEPCYKAALQKQQAGQQQQTPAAPRPPAAPAAAARPAQNPAPRPPAAPTVRKPAAAETPAAAPSAPKPLPDFCPACGAPTLPGRRICIKCNRDMTKLDKLLAMRAANAKASTEAKVGVAVGIFLKVAVIVIVLGAFAFIGWGIYASVNPGGPFDDYPVKRADAVHDILADIQTGTDKSYKKAFELVSFRERATNNPNEDQLYKMVYKKMHDEFAQKYGNDWLSTVKIENAEPDSTEEVVPFTVTMPNGDVYHVDTEAQISVTQAVANLTVRRDKPEYHENGKRHFGILEIEEYTVHPHTNMQDMAGPGKPEPLPTLQDFHPNGK
jgi:hypothetical protein